MSVVKGLSWLGVSVLAHATLLVLAQGQRARANPEDAQASWDRAAAADTVSLGADEFIDVGDVGADEPDEPAPAPDNREPEAPVPDTAEIEGTTKLDAAQHSADSEAPGRAPPVQARAETPKHASPKPEQTESEGEDWLGIEDQLDEPEAQPAPTTAPKPDFRDVLVQRLLAAERRKQQLRRKPEAEPTPTAAPALPAPGPAGDVVVSAAPQDLADRFTRAVTEAEKNNPAWATHPLGTVGSVLVRLSLKDGVLEAPKFDGTPPALLRRLVDKTLFLLRRGNFALPFSSERAGEHWFRIEVRLSQVEDVNRYAYERPTRSRPGRAFFVLPSGRLFEAFVDPNVAPPRGRVAPTSGAK
jgi:hypothetical protein